DVTNMVRLFHWFGDQWVLHDAKAIWRKGDELIDQLKQQGEDLRQLVTRKAPPEAIEAQTQKIIELNVELNRAGVQFTQVLGQAARVTEGLLIGGLIGVAVLLSLVSIAQVRQVLIKQARHQEAISQVHRRWELASRAAGFGLYEMDQATGLIALDEKAAALHGLPPQATVVPRTTIRDLIVEGDAARTRQETDQALRDGQDYKVVYRVIHPNGQIRALEATGRLIQADKNHPARLMGILRDVTDELNQAELALRRDAAERVAQAQREFLSRLSHELRTPLNAILGFAQLMQMDRQHTSAAQIQQVEMILGAGQQLLSLVEDVLDLSKVESGHIHMQLQPVDAVCAVRSCLPLIDGHLKRHQLHLIEALPAEPLWVHADPQRLHQILINLLTNACKYNREGGSVTVSVTAQTESPRRIRISVGDSGMGMTQDELNELFQPFKRINPNPEVEGTGLGLYIVKQLVDRMNGEVEVVSEAGHGSTFTILLPEDPSPPSGSKPLV
ncbi:MAG TPA: ATP-binding protein, partial [Aquabacterium sp.]|nr:ATP-binding protein [Aquabacterium sp.]